MGGRLHIGTSGYQYDDWKGRFYPPELPKRRWLAYYVGAFDTVEINNTFYHLPAPSTFDHWLEQAPRGFRYALKFSRFGTHVKRLKEPEEPIRRFLELARRLGTALGPVLVQLPPRFDVNPERLERFLDAAPGRIRWAVEFRDRRWLAEPIYRILRRHRAALCIHDLLDDHPRCVTAPFTYLRYHGVDYGGGYSPQLLGAEAKRIRRTLADGIDVYAYFNNDKEGHAVHDAKALARYCDARRVAAK